MENRRSDMHILFLVARADHHVQHTPGHHGGVDGRRSQRREFRRRYGNVHEHRRRGQGAQSQSVGSESGQDSRGRPSGSR